MKKILLMLLMLQFSLYTQIKLKDDQFDRDKEDPAEEELSDEEIQKLIEKGRRPVFKRTASSWIYSHLSAMGAYYNRPRNMNISKLMLEVKAIVEKKKLEKELEDMNSLVIYDLIANIPALKDNLAKTNRSRMEYIKRRLVKYYKTNQAYPTKLNVLKLDKKYAKDKDGAFVGIYLPCGRHHFLFCLHTHWAQ